MNIKMTENDRNTCKKKMRFSSTIKWSTIACSGFDAFLVMIFRIIMSKNVDNENENDYINKNIWAALSFWGSILMTIIVKGILITFLWIELNFFIKKHYEVRINESQFGD